MRPSFAGIEPATLPAVPALGADPANFSVICAGASLRYCFGPREPELPG